MQLCKSFKLITLNMFLLAMNGEHTSPPDGLCLVIFSEINSTPASFSPSGCTSQAAMC